MPLPCLMNPTMRIAILTQVYVPDPASVGQHMHDFAAAMAARGHAVTVYCSSRGYDDPTQRYPRSEWREGVTIKRYALPFFSKRNMPLRVFGSAWAQAALFFDTLLTRRPDVVFFSTSPPLVGITATLATRLRSLLTLGRRRPRLAYWAMDLNPDQLLAMGKVRPDSFTHRALEGANRFILRNADLSIALDRFMEGRLRGPGRRPNEIVVLPPWPHEDATVEPSAATDPNAFRDKHGLNGKFVVMYSGNHTPANPLDTLLQATLTFKGDDSIRFLFVGGGGLKPQVERHIAEHNLTNCLSLPYQPLATLRDSLGSADVHVVSLGPDMVGIVHPCKVYGAMAAARPILFFGPRPSHVTDLIDRASIGLPVAHGDAAGAVEAIRTLRAMAPAERDAMGRRALAALRADLSRPALSGALCNAVEGLAVRRPDAAG